MPSRTRGLAKLVGANAASTPFGLAASQHGTAGLLIGAVVVITTTALAADAPFRLAALIIAVRERRWFIRHTASVDDAIRLNTMVRTPPQDAVRPVRRDLGPASNPHRARTKN